MFELSKGRNLLKIGRFSSEPEAEAGQIRQCPHGRHITDRVRLNYVKTREVREPGEWRRQAAFGLENSGVGGRRFEMMGGGLTGDVL